MKLLFGVYFQSKKLRRCPSGGMPFQLILASMPRNPSKSFLHAYFLIALTLLLLTTFAGILAMLQ
jgi:hypothetical protein